VFGGDFLFTGSRVEWTKFRASISNISIPYYLVPGNFKTPSSPSTLVSFSSLVPANTTDENKKDYCNHSK